MGQGQSCNKLNEFGNVCEIHNCVKLVKGLSSNSASPSDTWILLFKDDTKYENIDIKSGFLKFFIDPSTLPPYYDYMDSVQGLDYEINVYRDIIRPLVDYNVCPNFIRYLGSGKSCSYGSMMEMLNGKTYNKTKDLINMRDLKDNFQDNFYHMYELEAGRKSINDIHNPNNMFRERAHNFKYNLLINETITSDAYTLSDHIEALYRNATQFREKDWCIIFQIIIACYSMSLTKINHNDLHAGNVYIEPYNRPLNYILGSHQSLYNIECGNIVKLYDFDRAYCERLGDNPLLDPSTGLDTYSQSNEFIPTRDMIKVFGYIYDKCLPDDQYIIKKILAKPGREQFLSDVYREGMFLRTPGGQPLSRQDYERNFKSAEEILMNVAKLTNRKVNDYTRKADIYKDTNNLYICIPQVFNPDGGLQGLSMAKQFSYRVQTQIAEHDCKKLLKDEISDKHRMIELKDSECKTLLDDAIKDKDMMLKMKDEQNERLLKIKEHDWNQLVDNIVNDKNDKIKQLTDKTNESLRQKDMEIQQKNMEIQQKNMEIQKKDMIIEKYLSEQFSKI